MPFLDSVFKIEKKAKRKSDVVGRFVWESSEPDPAACRWRGKNCVSELVRLEMSRVRRSRAIQSLSGHLLVLKGKDADWKKFEVDTARWGEVMRVRTRAVCSRLSCLAWI
jgi:hypothetical protein